MITFYSGENIPVILITIYSKTDRADLSQKEKNALLQRGKELVAAYESKVIKKAGP